MKRREFLQAAGVASIAALLGPSRARAQLPLRFADMHAHLRLKQANTMRPFMIGIGTDMDGLGRSTLPSYTEFAELPGYLESRGLNDAAIDGILGGNYIRVLRQAMSI